MPWGGAIALALIVIPVVLSTTENMLHLVPNTLREAASALGAPQWEVIAYVTLRGTHPHLDRNLLAVARIAARQPPAFTALSNQFWTPI